MATIRDMLHEFELWFASLPPDFAFLLALPFLVGLAGVVGDAVRKCRDRADIH